MKTWVKYLISGTIGYLVGASIDTMIITSRKKKNISKNARDPLKKPVGFVVIVHDGNDYQQVVDVAVDFYEKDFNRLINGKGDTITLERRHITNSQKNQVS
jgi:hypothetical protein